MYLMENCSWEFATTLFDIWTAALCYVCKHAEGIHWSEHAANIFDVARVDQTMKIN